jgi:hypothetical protein
MAVLLVAAPAIGQSAMAGEPASQAPANGAVLETNSDAFWSKDLSAEQPGDADTGAASDLEATRAAVDRRSGSAISLGVSGWVGGQITGHSR